MRSTHGTYEEMEKNANDTDDFESNNPMTVDSALMSHLISIDNSCSLHINESQETINQCLQEARLHGLFDHDEALTEFSDELGVLVNDNIHVQEQDWIHEYEQCKQTWKSTVIHEQEDCLDCNEQESHEHIIMTLDGLPSEDATVNQIQASHLQEKSKADNVSDMQTNSHLMNCRPQSTKP